MSLSNSQSDQFQQLTVQSLESFNDEIANADETTDPDFDRFKLLIDQSVFEKEDVSVFESLYTPPEKVEEVVFKPLIEKKDDKKKKETKEIQAEHAEEEVEEKIIDESVETPEEKGYREGLEKGIPAGEKQGYDKGYEQGLKQGEEEGLKKGHEEGVAQGVDEGREQGFKEGEDQARKEVMEQAAEIINSLEDALTKSSQTLEKLVDVYEDRIIDLIQKIAQKAVLAKIETDEEVVKPLIIESLKHLVQPEEVILSVSPEDYEYVDMVKDDFFDLVESLNAVSVLSDPSVKRGGCRLETKTASVSTDPESRLRDIFEAMKNPGAL